MFDCLIHLVEQITTCYKQHIAYYSAIALPLITIPPFKCGWSLLMSCHPRPEKFDVALSALTKHIFGTRLRSTKNDTTSIIMHTFRAHSIDQIPGYQNYILCPGVWLANSTLRSTVRVKNVTILSCNVGTSVSFENCDYFGPGPKTLFHYLE